MDVAKGVSLGPYEIDAPIGAGGMGQVWRARDKRIGRDVAIKILPEVYSAEDERLRRFEQEARTAGALNHPGLVTIFDVGTTDGCPYIVMELLEGKTLRDVMGDLVQVALPFRKAVDYAIQIASALAVAHEKGIVHRDLKPENIFVTYDNRVKILDFGLAKLVESSNHENTGRTDKHLTSAGIAVGTPSYMSPEQATAKAVDHRTDIFSLGTVLYEMLSGRRAFERPLVLETMLAVINDTPPSLSTLSAEMPVMLDVIVRHCMEKDPRERFQSARDLAFQLRMLPEFQNVATASLLMAPAAKRRPMWRIAIAIVALLALAAVAGWRFLGSRAFASLPRGAARTYKQLTFGDGVALFPTLAPDGKTFAYVSSTSGNRDIYVQRVDGRTAIDLTADSPADDSEPAFSPDGSQIAFRSERDGGGIFIMGATGESVRRLTDFGHNPAWSPDGRRIVVSTAGVDLRPDIHPRDGALWIVDEATGAKRPLLQPHSGGSGFDSDAMQPSWSPHGKRIAFWGVSSRTGQRDIWTIDPDAPQPGQTIERATTDAALHWNPVWSPDGMYLYFGSDADGTMNVRRVAIDEESGKPVGPQQPLSLPALRSGQFALSQKGDLVYGTVTPSFRLIAFAFDAATGKLGDPKPLFGGSQEINFFDPSPDGREIAFTTGGAQEDVFIANRDGTRLRQLTNDPARDRGVTWSPDGKKLYFYSNRGGTYQIDVINADGSGLAPVTNDADVRRIGARNIYMPHVSPDGTLLAVGTDGSGAALVHLDRPLGQRLEAFGPMQQPTWSPDGKWLVGTSASGITLYSMTRRKFETIVNAGVAPQWLPDGHRIVYFDRKSIYVLDLSDRRVTKIDDPAVASLADTSPVTPLFSRDGSTLYAYETVQQGDVWLAHLRND